MAAVIEHLPTLDDQVRLAALRDRLEAGIAGALPDVEILGAKTTRICNTSCIRFAGCEGDGIMMALDIDGICVSTGSACSSGSIEPSPILLGMGLTRAEAKETVRFSLPPNISAEEIDVAIDATIRVVRKIRSISESL